jgi:hypothetical protein
VYEFVVGDKKTVYPPPKINLKDECTLQVKTLSEAKVSELWKEIKSSLSQNWSE